MKKKEKKAWILSIALVVFASLYPVIFTYAQNVSEVDFVEVISLAFFYPLMGLVLWGGFTIITKAPLRSALSTVLLVFFLSNYMLIQKVVQMIFENLKYWHILPMGLLVLGHIIYFIFRFEEKSYEDIVGVGGLIIVVLLLINWIPAIPTIYQKITYASEETKCLIEVENSNQPNIYWFIFDECASFSVIDNFYKYSDKTNYNTLISQGFYVSDTSRNGAIDTHRVLTNCINLDYVVKPSMDLVEIETYRSNPLLYKILQENGYELRGIGDTNWLNVESITTVTKEQGETADGEGIVEMILRNTFVAPFLTISLSEMEKLILDTIGFFQNPENITPESSQFNFVYVCSPHVPFLFDENGNSVAAANYSNWEDPKYYIGQYRFVMDQIVKVTDTIIEKDPNSVIVLQSDHGPRHTAGLTFEQKTSVLNCVYYMGEDISQIEGKSSINTWRLVLNRLLDCDLKEVPDYYEE